MKHKGRINNGRFVPSNTKLWAIDQELHEGKLVTVEIREDGKTYNGNIDGFYFNVIVDAASHLEDFADCYSRMDVHHKLMYAITGRYEAYGDALRVIKDSYSKMTHADKIQYVQKVKLYLQVEHNVNLEDDGCTDRVE